MTLESEAGREQRDLGVGFTRLAKTSEKRSELVSDQGEKNGTAVGSFAVGRKAPSENLTGKHVQCLER